LFSNQYRPNFNYTKFLSIIQRLYFAYGQPSV